MAVRIITDSGSDILPGEIDDLTVLPLTVAFGTDVYHDGVDLSHERFFELLVEEKELPTTGQVPPYRFSQAFDEVEAAGDEAVVITISSKVSGTWESGATAAEGRDAIHVVDSLNVSVGERILVESALEMAASGSSASKIAARLEELRREVRFLALLDTLEYLRRGGRISNVSAALGTMLAIKPVVTIADGKVVVTEKPRGLRNGRKIIAQQVRDEGGIDFTHPCCIGYTGNSEKPAREFLDGCKDLWEGKGEVPVASIGATIGTHTGPGGFLFAYFANGSEA